MSTVLVSGATGFIAQHIIKQLLEKKYKVIGTVRTDAKGQHLTKNFNNPNFLYVLVSNLATPGGFDEVFQQHPEIEYFLHTASPFTLSDDNVEENLLKPALAGTKEALTSAHAYGKNLKKLVVTSSYAAMGWTYLVDKSIPDDVYIDEASWTDIPWDVAAKSDGLTAYIASKAHAEREVWNFKERETPNFDLAVVNPTYVYGPQAFDSDVTEHMGETSEIINRIIKLQPGETPHRDRGLCIDVRDVAGAHIIAMERDECTDKRLLLFNAAFSEQNFLDLVHKFYPEQFKNVPIGDPKTTQATLTKTFWGDIHNEKTREILKQDWYSHEKSVKDILEQIIRVRGL
ncbi:NAD(P)-binding protein [Suhomyces tanzawaensis NRRL Y-17324]|uniref:NAD(P)-binding protein n=1 Tax=Suhomyces tanzawaensis NRRL Y-17324 TaxID=984487 RepID=A0A1E4SCU5_9ASCO|nr:NAD(P)-binding protein [Suhomyces tanzawaensis NRRL Y-17324]ODV77212.1 NAD(P)-binding protein [Suhomyces tanzawaensis NRRL Y-17324]